MFTCTFISLALKMHIFNARGELILEVLGDVSETNNNREATV